MHALLNEPLTAGISTPLNPPFWSFTDEQEKRENTATSAKTMTASAPKMEAFTFGEPVRYSIAVTFWITSSASVTADV